MDGDGDPRRALHPRPRDQETEEQQERRDEMRRREKASKKARKKRRRDRRRGTLELEQGPSELPPEAPRPDYTLAWRPILAEDHPEPPAFQNQAPPYHPHYVRQLHRHRHEILAHQRREDLERAKKARQEALARRRPSSSRQTGSSAPAGTATRVRQSVLYSDRPRRSWRPTSNKLPVDVHASEVNSSEFEALTLGQSPPTLDSTHSDVGRGVLDSTIVEPSALEQELLAQRTREFEEWWINQPIFDSFTEAIKYTINITNARANAREESMVAPEQDIPKWVVPPEQEIRISMVAPEQEVPTGGQEEIARNGKKWMSEEAIVAFKKYMEKRDDSKGFEYQFDELLCQCFNVEHYFKIFHHLNFTVKRRALGSADWTSQLYFAEVKEILRQKNYICYPLEPDEEGDCYACKNQGMDELRHPLVGGFDRGREDTEFPYYCEDWGSEEEYNDREPGEESDCDEAW